VPELDQLVLRLRGEPAQAAGADSKKAVAEPSDALLQKHPPVKRGPQAAAARQELQALAVHQESV
jgi:hypothetical protein